MHVIDGLIDIPDLIRVHHQPCVRTDFFANDAAAANVVFDLPFKPFVWAFLAFPTAGLFVLRKRKELPFERGTWKILVLALPLLLLVAAKGVSEWDEFSHWLATVKFILQTDAFPDRQTPTTSATFPAYPYNWPMLSYLVGRLAGHFVENAGGVLNVLVLLCFGPVSVRMVCLGAGIERPHRWTWGMTALALAAVTILNPIWVQKVILTAYADSSSAVAVGFAGVLGWTLLGGLGEGDARRSEVGRRHRQQFQADRAIDDAGDGVEGDHLDERVERVGEQGEGVGCQGVGVD